MDVDQDQPKKRLMIRQMVLENFKSYAGAQHVGPFHKVCNLAGFSLCLPWHCCCS